MRTRSLYKHRERNVRKHETLEDYLDGIVSAAQIGDEYRDKLDYASCTIDQLLRFIELRSGVIVTKFSSQGDIIDILKRLDRDATFRFMDLTAELRIEIYEYLLHHDLYSNSIAYPEILRTCKLVRKEAQPILEIQSTARIEVDFLHDHRTLNLFPVAGDPGQTVSQIYAIGNMKCHLVKRAEWPKLPHYPRVLATTHFNRLKNVRNLTVDLDIMDRTPTGTTAVHLTGYFFEMLVKVCKNLRRVEVDVSGFRTALAGRERVLLEILEPLIYLPDHATLRLDGVSKRTEKKFWSMAADA